MLLCVCRFYYQEFVSVSEKLFLEVASLKWASPKVFEDVLAAKGVSRRKVIVPSLVGEAGFECLRVKIIEEEEFLVLDGLQKQPGKESLFEKVSSPSCDTLFFFGWEPEDLNAKHSLGLLVSYWARDPKVTKLKLTYGFGEACLGVFGEGYGGRGSVPSYGMNVYCKKRGRGTTWTTDSPAQDPIDRAQQQYYRKDHWNQLMEPWARKKINQLSGDVRDAARRCNPYLMKMVGEICTRQILTSGHIPKSDLHPNIGANIPLMSFANVNHTDKADKVSKKQVQEWKNLAVRKKWKYCLKVLQQKNFCLPTTCGYQVVLKNENVRNLLQVKSYFGMFGLGMAMQIEDGYLHHFMGALFSHQTCVCLCKRIDDGKVCANNNDNQLLIIGWGTCGGKREVTEAAVTGVADGGGQGCIAVAEGSGETEAAGGGGDAAEDSGGVVVI